jgi:Copper chaperone
MRQTRMDEVVLRIPDMSCTKCVNIITKELKLIDGVENFKIKLKLKTIEMEYDTSIISIDDIRDSLKEKGYASLLVN